MTRPEAKGADSMATLAQKVHFLSQPSAYAERPFEVRAIETHMSWVFLAGERVFKIKKPVTFPFLDFSSLAAREFNCREEVRLNRRLAPDIYLGVVPLTESAAGELKIDGDGETVEWMVEMKRLPRADMLDVRIAEHHVTAEEIADLGETLADFYAASAPQTADGHLYLAHLLDEQEVNRKLLMRPDFGLVAEAEPLLDRFEGLLAQETPTITARIAEGHIVEGHGDLRPQHVCLGAPVHIIDCLEFNRGMRILDPYDEVNYLGLECAISGAAFIRPALISRLTARLGAPPPQLLMVCYSVFRCLLRARICMAHLLDPSPRQPQTWPSRARLYLDLARAELAGLSPREGGGSSRPRANA